MRCGSAAVLDGSLKGGKINDPEAVARVLQQLHARTEITQTRALIAASDTVGTFRVLHPEPASPPREIDAIVTRELQFDPQRMATHWVEVAGQGGRRAIYASAWDRELVKNVTEAVKIAGLEPAVVELKSSSVARVVPMASAVLVDAVSNPVEMILIDEHLPQVWHSFGVSEPLGDNAAQALATPLRSMLRYYRRQREGGFDRAAPVLIAAEQTLASSVLRELSELIDQPVQPLPAPTRVPPSVRHVTYLACLGLVMRRNA